MSFEIVCVCMLGGGAGSGQVGVHVLAPFLSGCGGRLHNTFVPALPLCHMGPEHVLPGVLCGKVSINAREC